MTQNEEDKLVRDASINEGRENSNVTVGNISAEGSESGELEDTEDNNELNNNHELNRNGGEAVDKSAAGNRNKQVNETREDSREDINEMEDDSDTEGELEPSMKNGPSKIDSKLTPAPTPSPSPPLPKRLGRREKYLLQNNPQNTQTHYGTLQTIFRRCIASILATRGISSNAKAFEFIAVLAEEYMDDLFSKLFKISQIQRRQQASLADLRMTMDHFGIRITDLEGELGLKSRYTDALNHLRIDPEQEQLHPEAEPFFHSPISDLKYLVPSKKVPGAHIPSWMPPLPPDHTFMSTPLYSRYMTEPRVLREKLVEEGRLAEAALRRIVGIDVDENGGDTIQVENGDVKELERELSGVDDLKEENEKKLETARVLKDNEDEVKKNINQDNDDSDSESDGDDFMDLELGNIKVKPVESIDEYVDNEGDVESTDSKDVIHKSVHFADSNGHKSEDEAGLFESESETAVGLTNESPPEPVTDLPTDLTTESTQFPTTSLPKSEKPRPFSLKISFGAKKSASVTEKTESHPHPSDFITLDSKNNSDDVVSYVKDRLQIIERRKRKHDSKKHPRFSEDYISAEETSASTIHHPASIDDEFKKVLAAVSKRTKKNPKSIPDQELVLWDSSRYV